MIVASYSTLAGLQSLSQPQRGGGKWCTWRSHLECTAWLWWSVLQAGASSTDWRGKATSAKLQIVRLKQAGRLAGKRAEGWTGRQVVSKARQEKQVWIFWWLALQVAVNSDELDKEHKRLGTICVLIPDFNTRPFHWPPLRATWPDAHVASVSFVAGIIHTVLPFSCSAQNFNRQNEPLHSWYRWWLACPSSYVCEHIRKHTCKPLQFGGWNFVTWITCVTKWKKAALHYVHAKTCGYVWMMAIRDTLLGVWFASTQVKHMLWMVVVQ